MNFIPKALCVWLCISGLIFCKPPRVSSNRLPSKPFISGDGFRSMADHVYDETDQSLEPDEVALGDIVFVKSDKLHVFFADIHPYVQYPYILVSHNSDASAPGEFESYLKDEKIIAWFGQNPTIMGVEKFVPIPIGVANRYVHKHGNSNNFKPFLSKEKMHKDYLLGYNFNARNNRAERGPLLQRFPGLDYVHNLSADQHPAYLSKMNRSKYILSPRGNGLDCHRTWEALIVGTIPIIKSSMLDELLDGLPVLIVEEWAMVDKSLLNYSYEHMSKYFKQDILPKITYAYWQEQLRSYQDVVRIDL